jgi:hypothetical protein
MTDSPLPERTAFFIIAPQRSGTTVLREALKEGGLFEAFGEVFHPEKHERHSFFAFLKRDPQAAALFLYPTEENCRTLFGRFLEYAASITARRFMLIDAKQNSLHHFNTVWHTPSQPPNMLGLIDEARIPVLRIRRRNLFKQLLSTMVAREKQT